MWAVSTTSQYLWTPAGTSTDTNLASVIGPSSVDVTVPPAIASKFGGTFKWMVTNSCRSHPSDPIYSDGDIAPDTGLYTFTADVCPNLAGTQFVVPAGMIRVAGVCVGSAAANRIVGTGGGTRSTPAPATTPCWAAQAMTRSAAAPARTAWAAARATTPPSAAPATTP